MPLAECEIRIKEMLVELEKSTGVYVHYLDCDRFESVDGGVGTSPERDESGPARRPCGRGVSARHYSPSVRI